MSTRIWLIVAPHRNDEEQVAPNEKDAARILLEVLHVGAVSLSRFPTGLAHYVYDVVTENGQSVVVRLARPDRKAYFRGALTWYEPLTRLGVPLPFLRYHELDEAVHGFPVMIMDRLLGTDLGDAYPALTHEQKRGIADHIVEIQRAVSRMPEGPGFGYAQTENDSGLHGTWKEVLDANLDRSHHRFARTGVLPPEIADRVSGLVQDNAPYLATVRPTCFLDDTTTKNVLVHHGSLSGIVDVDNVAYGDLLYNLALTRMALLSAGMDTIYTEYWATRLSLSPEQSQAVSLYTAVFCVDFLSETGYRFNQDQPEPNDAERVKKLIALLDILCDEVTDHPTPTDVQESTAAHLEALLREGLESGEPIPGTEDYIRQKRAEAVKRIESTA